MAGEDAVGALAAHGQGAALDVADGDLQDAVVGAVVDGQGAADFLDVDIAHDAASVDVQLTEVIRPLLVGECHRAAAVGCDSLVIGPGVI